MNRRRFLQTLVAGAAVAPELPGMLARCTAPRDTLLFPWFQTAGTFHASPAYEAAIEAAFRRSSDAPDIDFMGGPADCEEFKRIWFEAFERSSTVAPHRTDTRGRYVWLVDFCDLEFPR